VILFWVFTTGCGLLFTIGFCTVCCTGGVTTGVTTGAAG